MNENMPNLGWYIELLRSEIERKIGRTLKSPEDFRTLSDAVFKDVHEPISESTIKRLWQYVSYPHTPRTSTLNSLAIFLGHRDWDAFCAYADSTLLSDSQFLDSKFIKASGLQVGTDIGLKWNPDRCCVVTYLGNNRFRVVSVENAKICAGMEFSSSVFVIGNPLVLYNIVPAPSDGRNVYVAARKGGLTDVQILKDGGDA